MKVKISIIIVLLACLIGCQQKIAQEVIKPRPLTEDEAMNEEISKIIVEEYMEKAGY